MTDTEQRVRLIVDLDRGPEPVSGVVCGEAAATPFTGWLELMGAVLAAMSTEANSGGFTC